MEAIKKFQQQKTDNDFLLWAKIDKLGDLTCMMAEKMHDAGIINGDLEQVKRKYQKADEDYETHIHKMAAEIMRR